MKDYTKAFRIITSAKGSVAASMVGTKLITITPNSILCNNS